MLEAEDFHPRMWLSFEFDYHECGCSNKHTHTHTHTGSTQENTLRYSVAQLLMVSSAMPENNAPVTIRGNVFVNNTAPSEAAALFQFELLGMSPVHHIIDHNVFVNNSLRGFDSTRPNGPLDRSAIAPIVGLVIVDARRANITFVNNILRNPAAPFELRVQARFPTGPLCV